MKPHYCTAVSPRMLASGITGRGSRDLGNIEKVRYLGMQKAGRFSQASSQLYRRINNGWEEDTDHELQRRDSQTVDLSSSSAQSSRRSAQSVITCSGMVVCAFGRHSCLFFSNQQPFILVPFINPNKNIAWLCWTLVNTSVCRGFPFWKDQMYILHCISKVQRISQRTIRK